MGDEMRYTRWYFGGLASAGAACVTHPLDLIKVQMQTQKGTGVTIVALTANILKQQGIMGLYTGISASVLRQMTYSLTRFGIYEYSKSHFKTKDGTKMPFYMSAFTAGLSGAAGGFVGTPADMVNVRMQNDIRLPKAHRRNYAHALHGLWSVYRKEGVLALWSGASMAVGRAVLMTIGQLSFYDLAKDTLLSTPYFVDNVATHVLSSLVAGGIATTMCQPMDVLKTRAMNAKQGDNRGMFKLIAATGREGPLAFFKGYIPAFVRLAPHTILTFVFLEQLTQNYGYTIED